MRTCTTCRSAPLARKKAWATWDQQDHRVGTGSEIRCCPRDLEADTTGRGQRRRFGQQSKGSGGVSLHEKPELTISISNMALGVCTHSGSSSTIIVKRLFVRSTSQIRRESNQSNRPFLYRVHWWKAWQEKRYSRTRFDKFRILIIKLLWFLIKKTYILSL